MLKKLFALLTVSGLVLGAHQASAGLTLRVTDGVTTNTVSDTDADGMISYSNSFADWSVVVANAFANPAIGDAYTDEMHLNSVAISGSPGSTLTIMLSNTDYTRTPANLVALVGGVASGTADFQLWSFASNTAFDMGALVYDSATMSSAFSDAFGALIDIASPYSLTMIATITHGGSGVSSFDFHTAVPEPGALGLLAIGIVGLGFARRRSQPRCVNGPSLQG